MLRQSLIEPSSEPPTGSAVLARHAARGLIACMTSLALWLPIALANTPPAQSGPKSTQADSLPLQALTQIDCPDFAQLARDYQSRFFAPMQFWSIEHLSRMGTRRVMYPFSGPDVITPLALFGSADHLILVADQMPELSASDGQTAQRIHKECQTQKFFSRLGYFRTNDLEGKGSVRPRFTKMLVYSALISGSTIERMIALDILPDGKLREMELASFSGYDGLRMVIKTPEQRRVTVDYLRINLSNSGLKPDSLEWRFLSEHMASTVFLKSASHLPQKSHFSVLTDLIASRAQVLVQDETGLDIEVMKRHFRVDAHGRFNRPHPLWKDSASAQRLSDFLSERPAIAQLPFVMGYEKPSGSIVLIGSRPGQRPAAISAVSSQRPAARP